MKASGFAVLITALFSSSVLSVDLEQWIQQQKNDSLKRMAANISPAGTSKGVVIASPSKSNPDYYYHWVRDGALVMDIIAMIYRNASGALKNEAHGMLEDFAAFSRSNQVSKALSGFGEPKFYVNGAPYEKDWGRPQNDGPALRAVTLIHWANQLLKEGQEAYVRKHLYANGAVVKADLEFVSHHWKDTCFDLWEEVKGHHFYTRMVQRRAMVEGGKLAAKLGDGGAADWYNYQAQALEKEINRHWDSGKGYLVTTLDWDGGAGYKYSNLDASVILGVLHGYAGDGFMSPKDPKVQATAKKLEETFKSLYPINQKGPSAPGIGRYPEDRYDGNGNSQGNPWFITTNAMAEYYFRLGQRGRGDDFLARSKFHTDEKNRFSEQINRVHGHMQGATDLTWSYASLISAIAYR